MSKPIHNIEDRSPKSDDQTNLNPIRLTSSSALYLDQGVPIHARPSRDVKDPAKIAIVVAHAAVVPFVVLAYIVGVAAVIDEMVAIDQIPSRGEGEINAISILLCRVTDEGVVAAMICQIESLFVIGNVISF